MRQITNEAGRIMRGSGSIVGEERALVEVPAQPRENGVLANSVSRLERRLQVGPRILDERRYRDRVEFVLVGGSPIPDADLVAGLIDQLTVVISDFAGQLVIRR